jgi:hypothetical protein
MIGCDESLDGENLIRCESAENVGDPQRLWITMKNNIYASQSVERLLGPFLARLSINVCSEQESVTG